MKIQAIAGLLVLLAAHTRAAEPVDLRTLSLEEFMHGQVGVPIDVPVAVPAIYEWATISKAPVSYAYWMRPQDVAPAESSGDLPVEHGYMYGKISLDVAYDKRKDVFVGADDRSTMRKLKAAFPSIVTTRLKYGEHSVLLMSMHDHRLGKPIYVMYVGTNADTNVIYVAFRPPHNSKEIGDYVWASLAETLVKSSKSREKARER